MGDELSRTLRAAKDSYDGRSPRSDATRRTILAHAVAERRQRRRAVMLFVPLAAVLALSTAWAAITGHLPEPVVRWWRHPTPSAPAVAPTQPPTIAPSMPASLPSPLATETTASAAPADAAKPADRNVAPSTRVTPSRSRVSPPTPAPDAPRDAETAAYAAAHRLHFADHDPARALGAWDDYLAQYPAGRYALEARYNRALCLVRLDRYDEARAALTPFAIGSYGGYRQKEANDLLEALGHGP